MAENNVLRIKGMDCADCALQIERAASKVKGVRSAKAYLGSSTLSVIAETEGLDMKAVANEIRKLGYGITDGQGTGGMTLYVEGMDCTDEVEIIDKKIKALSGIGDYRVNLVSQSLNLVYDPTVISAHEIINKGKIT